MGRDPLSSGDRGLPSTPRGSLSSSSPGWALNRLWSPSEWDLGAELCLHSPCSLHTLMTPCFPPQTFGGPLLLVLNPHRPLPLFSPEVQASYHPRKALSTTPYVTLPH